MSTPNTRFLCAVAAVAIAATVAGPAVAAVGRGRSLAAHQPAPTARRRPAPADTPLAWTDISGRTHAVSAAEGRTTVLLFGSTSCPCADGYTSRSLALHRDYASRGVRFFTVFSNRGVPREEVAAYVVSRKIETPVVHDPEGRLSARFGVVATPTAVVLGPDGGVVYRGRIDDSPEPVAVTRHYVREALDALLSGSTPALKATAAIGCAVQGKQAAAARTPAPRLENGLGEIRFAVTTNSQEAQAWFNQGMARWFGFNFPEAEISFREALRRDRECAMAHWGIALALGMNYNMDFDPARLNEAQQAAEEASRLAGKASAKERSLIRAMLLRSRLTDGRQNLAAYRDEMARIYNAHREDVHISVLYAAAVMDMYPWDLWQPDGRPRLGTLEAILVLEDAQRRDPNHIGVHHFYIHATEGSPQPERALASARRLGELAPRSGHLVHMPAHTFIRVGDYSASAVSNARAAGVDGAYFAARGATSRYAGYYTHNLDFLIAAYLMEGRTREAIQAVRELAEVSARLAPDEAPIWCASSSGAMGVYARCGRWDAILASAPPEPGNAMAVAMWRYAKGMARLAKGELSQAENELQILREAAPAAVKAVPDIPMPGFTVSFQKAFQIPVPLLAGKLALARGDGEAGLRHLRDALAVEDSMPYLEPAVWRYPVREALGGALLRLNRSAEAERVFREDLERNRKSGRSLFGLMHALERQGKTAEARQVRAQFQEAWKRADLALDVRDL